MGFVHLHVHSEYSLLDAMCRIPELVEAAVRHGMPALALTDHGALSGTIKFYQACTEAGIKPLLGAELYVAPGSRFSRDPVQDRSPYHLVVLAQDAEGWRNLLVLVNRAHTEGFYYKPRVDRELLAEHSRGLIALSSCESGEVQRWLLQGRWAEAREAAGRLAEIFPGRFYLELQDHNLARGRELIRKQLALAKELGLPVVATADVHYLRPEDAEPHQVLINIQAGKKLDDPDARSFEGTDYHFLSPEEMAAKFREIPEALANTLRIAEACELKLAFDQRLLPRFPVEGRTPQEELERRAWEGARRRYGEAIPPEVSERLRYELSVIGRMDLAPYFLIVADFVDYARRRGIPVGPGRGSAAGSLVAYCLGITQVDPLKFGLLFERFLNPERVSLPDIDIDFCMRRRDEVLAYVAEKYGRDHIAQIGTFDRMASRSVIRDVARVLGLPHEKADRIAKLVPFGMPLAQALEQIPKLKEYAEEEPRLFAIALKLEGLLRNASTHAAGVVIAPEPLEKFVPLLRLPDDQFVTQFDMHDLEALGLLKMDFLGLRNLTLLSDVQKLLRERRGMEIRLEEIPLDDPATYALLRAGETSGVFQLESAGMRALIRRLAPTEFRDLIALLALYRPGPLESGMVDDYIERKHGRQPVTYPHERVRDILEETYGLPIYQDQVMLMAQRLAGFTLAEADLLRKAMGKKKPEVMAEMRARFVAGCVQNGIPEAEAEAIFADIEKFASYAFAKAHAAAYAFITYWTAYFKAHFPTEFMAALLTSVQDNIEKVAAYIEECRGMGIQVLPPDVNESDVGFTPVGEGTIRFGLGAIKHVGEGAVAAILAARRLGPFRDFWDFCLRVDPERVNRETLECLIKAGALDRFGLTRKAMMALVEEGLRWAQRARKERLSGQASLFEEALVTPQLPVTPEEYPKEELLRFEKELLGLYLSGHPLDLHEEKIRNLGAVPLAEAFGRAGAFLVAGRVKDLRTVATPEGTMAFFTLEDKTGEAEVVVRPKVWAKCPGLREEDVVALQAVWTERNGVARLAALALEPLSGAAPIARCWIRLPLAALDPAKVEELLRIVADHLGPVPLGVVVVDGAREARVLAGPRYFVQPTPELGEALRRLGAEMVLE
ncbi:MAG: DNA polymerase III subunit alpha [Candidatus Bipolaricaulota bacterium]|nr:DNA polymerase III subunit alpha [Candidatus Bipolaricaulota bacterium]